MDKPAVKPVGWQNIGTYKVGALKSFTIPDKLSESAFGSLPSAEVYTATASNCLIPILIYDQGSVSLSS